MKPISIFHFKDSRSRFMRSPAITTGSMHLRDSTPILLEPLAARAAIAARVDADLGLTSTNARRIDRLLSEAARLRSLYGVKVGTQRAMFFELQTADFALLAIDTGILRTVDEHQWAWIERALDRSQASSPWPSWAIHVSPAVMIPPRSPKVMMSPNHRRSLRRSINS